MNTPSSNEPELFYRVSGKGDAVLLIHGACADGDFFSDTARFLSGTNTVILYDRRGSGRSEAPADHDYSVEAQAEDAARIIRSTVGRCHVVAHSAGSQVAMQLVVRHPELIGRVFLHEPTAFAGLSIMDEVAPVYQKLCESTAAGKYSRAMSLFLQFINSGDPRARTPTVEELSRLERNQMCYLRNELELFWHYRPDYPALKQMDITVGVGELSRDTALWTTAHQCAERLGCRPVYFPGTHNCAYDLPREFAYLVHGCLSDEGGRNELPL